MINDGNLDDDADEEIGGKSVVHLHKFGRMTKWLIDWLIDDWMVSDELDTMEMKLGEHVVFFLIKWAHAR